MKQTVPGLSPTEPRPDAVPWRCRCGNLLGFVERGWLCSKHRGRTVQAPLPARVRCEHCGRRQCLRSIAATPGEDDATGEASRE